MRWRIYYGDESIYDEADVSKAPKIGVQVVAEKRDSRTIQHSMGNFYVWNGKIWQVTNKGVEHWPDDYIVLEGKEIDTEKFKEIRGRAIDWLHVPV